MALLRWKVVQVIQEAKEAITYVLAETSGASFSYEAGQFLTFLLTFHGQEVRRSFSLGSAPGIEAQVFITVKKKENGAISRYILEHWGVGTEVESLPPTGRFTLTTSPTHRRQVFFIAAGSGIVPVFALLKKLLHDEPHSRAVLVYQNHDEQHIIYHRALQQLAEQYPASFTRIDLLSAPILHDLPHQRLNNGLLEVIVGRYLKEPAGNVLFYTCGPAAFMRMVQFTLRVMNIPAEHIYKENFTVDVVPPPAFTLDDKPRMAHVQWRGQLYSFPVRFPDTILYAALKQGIKLPYSCKGGRCSACTAQCTSGTVKMNMNEVLTEDDLRKGLVLTCVGYAVTDIMLEL
jgi:ring-1,2-phenylacetyl-CoA epoxidase subunit PaaE